MMRVFIAMQTRRRNWRRETQGRSIMRMMRVLYRYADTEQRLRKRGPRSDRTTEHAYINALVIDTYSPGISPAPPYPTRMVKSSEVDTRRRVMFTNLEKPRPVDLSRGEIPELGQQVGLRRQVELTSGSTSKETS